MALVTADRVRDTSTTTGTGAFTVSGTAPQSYRTFSAVCSVSDTFYYAIEHPTGSEWECGLATYSATNTITRTTVHASSNAGSAVNFTAGTKNVYLALTTAQIATFSGISNVVEDLTPQLGGQLDVNGFALGDGTLELLKFTETASAVNEITVANAATAGRPKISATGDDANIGLDITSKGTGNVNIQINGTTRAAAVSATWSPGADDGSALGSTALKWSDLHLASGAVINFNAGDVTITHGANALAIGGGTVTFDAIVPGTIVDASGNEQIIFSSTASAVNEWTITNAATGGHPVLAATGDDASINARITSKGAGSVDLQVGGTTKVAVSSGAVAPGTDDGLAIGSTALKWSDLFLASGGVINWAAGNATITHSTGLLTSNVAFSIGTSNALTAGTIELGHASANTLSASGGVLSIEGAAVATLPTAQTFTAKQTLTASVAAELGAASGNTGKLDFKGTTSGTVSLSVADAAGTWTMKLPTSAGTNNYFLKTDGSGNTSWAAGGGSPGGSSGQLQYNDSSAFGGANLWRESANESAQRNSTTAQTFNVYNSYTDASNYSRIRFYYPFSNAAAINVEGAGTGASTLTSFAFGCNAAGFFNWNYSVANSWAFNGGPLVYETDNTYDFGESANRRPRTGYFATRVQAKTVRHEGVTVANLPASPVAGDVAYVTDGSSTTWGATQTGGGSNKTLVFYNGTNWTVCGI